MSTAQAIANYVNILHFSPIYPNEACKVGTRDGLTDLRFDLKFGTSVLLPSWGECLEAIKDEPDRYVVAPACVLPVA